MLRYFLLFLIFFCTSCSVGLSQPTDKSILTEIYGNCAEVQVNNKTIYSAKYVPTVRHDGRYRPCEDESDSLEYSVYSTEKMKTADTEYFVVFCKTHETGPGYCNNRWFDAAIYVPVKSGEKVVAYKLVCFQPFVYETNRGEVEVKKVKINENENGFLFTSTFNQMGSSSAGSVFFSTPSGITEELNFTLYEAHDCMQSDMWLKKYPFKINFKKNDSESKYYDLYVTSVHETSNKKYDGCGLYFKHTRFVNNEYGYQLLSNEFEFIEEIKK